MVGFRVGILGGLITGCAAASSHRQPAKLTPPFSKWNDRTGCASSSDSAAHPLSGSRRKTPPAARYSSSNPATRQPGNPDRRPHQPPIRIAPQQRYHIAGIEAAAAFAEAATWAGLTAAMADCLWDAVARADPTGGDITATPGRRGQARETARRLGLPSSVTARLTEGIHVPQERIDRVALADTTWWRPADK